MASTTMSEIGSDGSMAIAIIEDTGCARASVLEEMKSQGEGDSDNKQQVSTRVSDIRETRADARPPSDNSSPMEATSSESRPGSLHRRKASGETSSAGEEIEAVTTEDGSSSKHYMKAPRMVELTESYSQTNVAKMSIREAETPQKKVKPLTVWPTVSLENNNNDIELTKADAALVDVLGVAKSLIDMMSLAESNHVDEAMVVDIGRLKLSDIARLSSDAQQRLGNNYN